MAQLSPLSVALPENGILRTFRVIKSKITASIPLHLCLDEHVLDRLDVGAEVEKSPHDFAQDEVLSGTAGKAEYPLEINWSIYSFDLNCTLHCTHLVLRSHGDQVFHRRAGAPLSDRPQKLATLW